MGFLIHRNSLPCIHVADHVVSPIIIFPHGEFIFDTLESEDDLAILLIPIGEYISKLIL